MDKDVRKTTMATSNSLKKKQRKADAPKGPRKTGTWGLALFALPFAAVGLGMLLLGVLPTLYDWGRMQGWQPVQATLVSASLNASRGSKSTTYGVSASYRYQVAGRDYEGQRVAIGSGNDNVGDFQQELGERLEAAHREGRAVPAWVNPADPSEAVLDRSLRLGLQLFKMLFVVVFGGAGLGMLYGAWRGRSGAAPRQARARTDANANTNAQTQAEAQALQPQRPRSRQIARADVEAACNLRRSPGGVRLYHPYGRSWKHTFIWLTVGAIFVGVAALGGGEMPTFVVFLLGGLGGAAVAGGVYAVANSLSVELDARGIRTERRLCGLMLVHHQAPASDIARLRSAMSYTVQTGSRQDTYYRVEVELRTGKKLTIANSLRGAPAAEALLAAIAAQTGYPR